MTTQIFVLTALVLAFSAALHSGDASVGEWKLSLTQSKPENAAAPPKVTHLKSLLSKTAPNQKAIVDSIGLTSLN